MNLLGDLRDFNCDPLAAMERAAARPSHLLHMGPIAVRLVVEPAAVYTILTSASNAIGRDAIALAAARKLLGTGIATTEFAEHREHRQAIKSAFAQRVIAEHEAVVQSEADRVFAEYGVPLKRRLEQFAIRVTARLLLGSDIEDTARIESATNEFHTSMRTEFRSPIQAVLPDWLPTRVKGATRRAKRELRIAVNEVLAGSHPTGSDVPSLMARFPNSTPELVASQTTNLLVAGATTTVPFLEWMLRHLSQRPDLVSGLQADFENASGRIIRETLRLTPPAWLVGRQAREAVDTPALKAHKGEFLYLSPYLTHRSAEYWERPTEFVPERWTDGFEDALPRGAYFPFAAGSHACLGGGIVYMEGRAILRALLNYWPDRARIEHDGFIPDPGFTLGAAGQTMLIKV